MDQANCPAARDLTPPVTDHLRAVLEEHPALQEPPDFPHHPTFGAASPTGMAGFLANPLIGLVLGMLARWVVTEIGPPLLAALRAEQQMHPGFDPSGILAVVNRLFTYLGAPPLTL